MINKLSHRAGLAMLGMTERDVYKAGLGALVRRIAITRYGVSPIPLSDELHKVMKDRRYRKTLIKVGDIGHKFLNDGIAGYSYKTVFMQILTENSVALRQLIEDAEDAGESLEITDELVDSIGSEVVGFFLTKYDLTDPDETGIASASQSPMISNIREVLTNVVDDVGVDCIFPDVHQHLTKLQSSA
jgi:hypothetical protein